MARFPLCARGLLAGLPRPPPAPTVTPAERAHLRDRIARTLGRVDPRARAAIDRLLDVAGSAFVQEVLRRSSATPSSVCASRLRVFFRIAQRNLSNDAWRRVSPRLAIVT